MDLYGGMMWMGWLMMLTPIAALVALTVLVAVLVRRPAAAARDESSLEILQRRFARGEIGQDEFDRMRASLLTRPQ